MMRVKLIRNYRTYSKGATLELPAGQGRELVDYGYAVEDRQQLLETATAAPEARTADLTPKRRKRVT